MKKPIDGPFTHMMAWAESGMKAKPTPTKNIYNSSGMVLARAINEDTAAMIAAAMNYCYAAGTRK